MRVLLFAAALVVWGNLLHPLIGSSAVLPGGSAAFVAAGALLVAASLLAARGLNLDRRELGLDGGTSRGIGVGALAGAGAALVGVIAYRLAPSVIGAPIVYEPLANVSNIELVTHIGVLLPLGTVIPEEVAFRGTLLGALVRDRVSRVAITDSAATFALWHVTVAWSTLGHTVIPVVLVIPAMIGALAVVFAGGVVLAALRMATGSLATTVAAHWVFNAVILIGLRP